jgi:hypothetical protein
VLDAKDLGGATVATSSEIDHRWQVNFPSVVNSDTGTGFRCFWYVQALKFSSTALGFAIGGKLNFNIV